MFFHFQAYSCTSQNVEKDTASKGDYWIKRCFSIIASLFKMGTSLKEIEKLAKILVPLIMILSRGHTGEIKG